MEDYLKNTPSFEHWKRVGIYPHHGFCIPLSAVRTKKNCGIGEFPDLVSLIDWCSLVKMDLIQLLALNECGPDPSPYNAISSCALDPIYIGLSSLGLVKKSPRLLAKLKDFTPYQTRQRIDHCLIRKMKMAFLKEYYNTFSQEIFSDASYKEFKEQNDWLIPYALFSSLSVVYKTNHWKKWPQKISCCSRESYEDLLWQYHKEMDFFFVLQFLAFSQMREAKNHATDKGVLLMGDIPILLSPDSVDVWKDRFLFDLDHVAGAPPDPLNTSGQKWGFYLFNWDAQDQTDYFFWKRRLKVASSIYHLYRIDHTLGFFRLWGILPKKKASEGCFFPKEEDKWEGLGRKNLSIMLESTNLLPIAEDLGVVPPFVGKVLKDFGICGMKIMRWEKENDRIIRYRSPSEYEPLSMTSVGTHDTSPLELWWKEQPKEALAYAKMANFTYTPKLTSEERMHILWQSHHTTSHFHVNLLGEYLGLFQELVWEKPEDEQINRPGKILPINWTYRMRPFLEDLFTHEKLLEKMEKILNPDHKQMTETF